ncbi:MAG TPA: NAD-dependent epimerase/dehydratase family protein, partial [Burkholderiales bacterium]
MEKLLIVGCGDIARRALPELLRRYRVSALVRTRDPSLVSAGAGLVEGDLDRAETLAALPAGALRIAHFAPPSEGGTHDLRTRALLAALETAARRGEMLPQRFVYLSTSGVYGDCGGARVDETRAPFPQTERAARRLDAEETLREWGGRLGVEIVVLRVPGIYAADRLPIERLRRGVPTLRAEDDVYTNHIHADDLAAAVIAALDGNAPPGVYNVSDDSEIRVGDWFDLVAGRCGLPRPPRIARIDAAGLIPAAQLSFMSESRRLVNRRMKDGLGVRLRY